MSLREWNRWQLRVARRYGRMHGFDLADAVAAIAPRFAAKHSHLRSW